MPWIWKRRGRCLFALHFWAGQGAAGDWTVQYGTLQAYFVEYFGPAKPTGGREARAQIQASHEAGQGKYECVVHPRFPRCCCSNSPKGSPRRV